MTLDDRSASSERERQALEFLRRGRKLRGFTHVQVQRVERRLTHGQRPLRRRVWLPRLAVLCLGLLAGSALASVLDLSRLPLLGSLFPARRSTVAPEARRSRTPTSRAPAVPAVPANLAQPERPSAPSAEPSAPVPPAPVVAALPPAAQSGSARSPALLPLRVAARAAEPVDRVPASSSLGGSATVTTIPRRSSATVPTDRAAALPPAPAPAPTTAPRLWTGTPRTPPPPLDDPVLAESRSFSAAVGRWHVDHDAKAALAALDAHQRRFPGGRLSLESTLLRAEILLQSGREREALVLLDAVSLGGLPRSRELRTVRGELRIKHDRCADGHHDLDEVLAKDAADSFGRRAAHAISLCPCNDQGRCRH